VGQGRKDKVTSLAEGVGWLCIRWGMAGFRRENWGGEGGCGVVGGDGVAEGQAEGGAPPG